jgi:hypothetical protein
LEQTIHVLFSVVFPQGAPRPGTPLHTRSIKADPFLRQTFEESQDYPVVKPQRWPESVHRVEVIIVGKSLQGT